MNDEAALTVRQYREITQKTAGAVELAVMIHLIVAQKSSGPWFDFSVRALAEVAGMSNGTIISAYRKLNKIGLIDRTIKPGHPTQIRVNI